MEKRKRRKREGDREVTHITIGENERYFEVTQTKFFSESWDKPFAWLVKLLLRRDAGVLFQPGSL